MSNGMGLLGIALSGLNVANRALTTIGHNIANVETPGYSRQRVDVETRPPQFYGEMLLGTGAGAYNVRRAYDAFVTGQVRLGNSASGYADALQELSQALDNLLADPETGLTPALQSFFDAASDVASDPTSLPARSVMLAEGEGLAARFQALDGAIADLDQAVNGRMAEAVSEVNSLARGIADLNDAIALYTGMGQGALPNDLLDQRDELLTQLASRVGITVTEQENGTVSVSVGGGQVLVSGRRVTELTVTPNEHQGARSEVGYGAGDQVRTISSLLSGGELGALVQFRAELLDPARNALGRVAVGLAATFNDLHASGLDLVGRAGGDFFAPIDETGVQVLRGAGNAEPGATVVARVTDAASLTASDYLLARTATGYTLTRLDDGAVRTLSGFPPAVEIAAEGLTLELEAGAIAEGDRFLIRPTAGGAAAFSVAVTDPREIAAAGPTGGTGNNESALALAALRDTPVLAGGQATYSDAYGELVVKVATGTRQAEVNQAAQGALLDQAVRSREAIAGVNLDEEAADLIRFQQYYQANARMVSVAATLFDTLLEAVGR